MDDVPDGSQRCRLCGEVKSLRDYDRDASYRNGYRKICKICRRDLRYPIVMEPLRTRRKVAEGGYWGMSSSSITVDEIYAALPGGFEVSSTYEKNGVVYQVLR